MKVKAQIIIILRDYGSFEGIQSSIRIASYEYVVKNFAE